MRYLTWPNYVVHISSKIFNPKAKHIKGKKNEITFIKNIEKNLIHDGKLFLLLSDLATQGFEVLAYRNL